MSLRIIALIISLVVLAVVSVLFMQSRSLPESVWSDRLDSDGVWLYPTNSDVASIEYGYYLPTFTANQMNYVNGTDQIYVYGNSQEAYAEIILPETAFTGSVIINGDLQPETTDFPDAFFEVVDENYSLGRIAIVDYVDEGTGPVSERFLKLFDFEIIPIQNL